MYIDPYYLLGGRRSNRWCPEAWEQSFVARFTRERQRVSAISSSEGRGQSMILWADSRWRRRAMNITLQGSTLPRKSVGRPPAGCHAGRSACRLTEIWRDAFFTAAQNVCQIGSFPKLLTVHVFPQSWSWYGCIKRLNYLFNEKSNELAPQRKSQNRQSPRVGMVPPKEVWWHWSMATA